MGRETKAEHTGSHYPNIACELLPPPHLGSYPGRTWRKLRRPTWALCSCRATAAGPAAAPQTEVMSGESDGFVAVFGELEILTASPPQRRWRAEVECASGGGRSLCV